MGDKIKAAWQWAWRVPGWLVRLHWWPTPAGIDTAVLERALGVLGMSWAGVQVMVAPQSVYVPWALALLLTAPLKVVLGYTQRLRWRAAMAAVGTGLWLCVAVASLVDLGASLAAQVPDSRYEYVTPQLFLSRAVLFAWVAWLWSYNFVELVTRAGKAKEAQWPQVERRRNERDN